MRRWTLTSPVPVTSLDTCTRMDQQRLRLRRIKVILSTLIPIILLCFFIVYILQKETLFKEDHDKQQQIKHDEYQQWLVNTYIEGISKVLLDISDINDIDEKYFHIRTQTLMILRRLDVKRKNDILLFLYERNLIQSNQLDLHGADLSHIELTCPYDFHHLQLSGVYLSKAIFINCRLLYANFDQANLFNARFINSSIQYASFIRAKLDYSYFTQTIVMYVNFNGSSLIQADFLQAKIFQGNNFRNADLYQAKLTEDQLKGKENSIIEHNFNNARFPNGSFGLFNPTESLVLNGNAETEVDHLCKYLLDDNFLKLQCFSDEQKTWKTIDNRTRLLTKTIRNITNGNDTIDTDYWGNCSFLLLSKTKVYQDIDLTEHSVLIDANHSAFSFLGFANCEEAYFGIDIYRSDNILYQSIPFSSTNCN